MIARIAFLFLLALGALPMSVHAQACDITLEVNKEVPVQPPDAAGIKLIAPAEVDTQTLVGAKPVSGKWKVTQAQLDLIKQVVARHADKRGEFRLATTNSQGELTIAPQMRFQLPGETPETAACVARTVAKAAAPKGPLATADDCLKVAQTWPLAKGRYRVPVLFNSDGGLCFRPSVIGQGDLLVAGMVFSQEEVAPTTNAVAEFPGCTLETAVPMLFSNGSADQIRLESLRTGDAKGLKGPDPKFLGAQACGMDTPAVNVKLTAGDKVTNVPTTLSQYKRYQATYHFGAIYSSLHSPDFALRNQAGTNIIVNKESQKRGPEYVAALVVQGLPRYFQRRAKRDDGLGDTNRWLYKGRDIVHDGGIADRIGLVITAGLDKPGERLGAGFSYEVGNGINIVALYEMAKLRQLDGVAVGDPFTGTVDTLPTRKEWEHKTSIGLTFDITYITKLFGSTKK